MKITKQELAQALFSVMDGCKGPGEIRYNTGLPEEKAKEIYDLYLRTIEVGRKDNYQFNEYFEIERSINWDRDNEVEDAFEITFGHLEKIMGAEDSAWDSITGDVDENICFKTMSESGKRDIEFADNIEKYLKDEKIRYKRVLNMDDPSKSSRVFLLSKKNFIKLYIIAQEA